MNNQQAVLYGVIGLLVGVIITWATANGNHTNMMNMMGMHTNMDSQGMMHDNDMTMGQMSQALQGKTGDDFDKAFLDEMIMHHQGAVDMANAAKTNAKHDEIKNMGNDIINTQTKEINQMKAWQSAWGYGTDSSGTHHMMSH